MPNIRNRLPFPDLDTGKYSIFLVLLALGFVATLLSENFLTETNLINVVRQVAVITIIAYGVMILIIGGMIDLSSGSVMALSGVIAVDMYKSTGSLTVAIAAGIAVGIACNIVSAVLVANFRVPAFIATLAMMMIARGAALQYTSGQNILQLGDITVLGQGMLGRVPIPVLFLILTTGIVWYLMSHTVFGRSVYALGGNEVAARAAGINVIKVKYQAFIVNGALVGFAGVIFMARVNAGLPNAGIGFELQAITAPIIGGTSFTGGIGTTSGTLAGSLIVGLLGNTMNLIGIGSYIQQMVTGVIIAIAVAYDIRARAGKRREVILKEGDADEDGDEELVDPQETEVTPGRNTPT